MLWSATILVTALMICHTKCIESSCFGFKTYASNHEDTVRDILNLISILTRPLDHITWKFEAFSEFYLFEKLIWKSRCPNIRMGTLLQYYIFTLRCHSPAIKHKKPVANIFQWKTPITWPKNWHWFFRLLGVVCRFSINIRIEVHFFVCIGKWKDTGRVNIFEKRFAQNKKKDVL